MRRPSFAIVVRAAALIAAAIGVYFLCLRPLHGQVVLRDVRQRTILAQSHGRQNATILAWSNLDDLERVARACRLDPAWYLLYGGNCELLQRYTEAADAYTRALAVDDRPEIYFSRGRVKLYLGQTDAATADMVTAARFDPSILEQIDGELRTRVAIAAGLKTKK